MAQDFGSAGREEPVRWLQSIATRRSSERSALIEIAATLPGPVPNLREFSAQLYERIDVMLREAAPPFEEFETLRVLRTAQIALANNLDIIFGELAQRDVTFLSFLKAGRSATTPYLTTTTVIAMSMVYLLPLPANMFN